MSGIFPALIARVLGCSLGLALLILAGVRCSSGVTVDPEPPMPTEKWALPPPPAPPLRIADAHWDCGFVLSDDARARLSERCRNEGGSPYVGVRTVECEERDAFGTKRWRIEASSMPSEATSHLGYVQLSGMGWLVLQ